jgi:dynein assembly factor 1
MKYIDDKPVFEDERRYAEAWGRGGLEEERREREKYKI